MSIRSKSKLVEAPATPARMPSLSEMPVAEGDFLPELHRDRLAGAALSYFGEIRAGKVSQARDATKKRKTGDDRDYRPMSPEAG